MEDNNNKYINKRVNMGRMLLFGLRWERIWIWILTPEQMTTRR